MTHEETKSVRGWLRGIVARGDLPYLAGIGASLVNAVVVWPLIARVLDAEKVGALAVDFAAASAISPILSLGLGTYLLLGSRVLDSRLPRREESVGGVLAGGLAFQALVVLGLLLALPIVGIAGFGIGVLSCGLASIILVQAFARAWLRPGKFVLLVLTGQSLALAVAAAVAAMSGAEAIPRAIAVTGVWLWLTALLLAIPSVFNPSRWRRLLMNALRLGVPTIPHLVLVAVGLQGTKLVVGDRLGPVGVAEYQFASLLGTAPLLIVQVVSGHIQQRYFADDSGVAPPRLLKAQVQQATKLSVGICFLVALCAPLVLRLMTPQGYDVAAMALATCGLLPAGVWLAWSDSQAAVALRHQKPLVLSLSTIAGTVLGLFASWLLVGTLGISGAGLGFSLGVAIRGLTAFALLHRLSIVGMSMKKLHLMILGPTLAFVIIVLIGAVTF